MVLPSIPSYRKRKILAFLNNYQVFTLYLNEVFLKISTLCIVGKPTYFHMISVNLYGNFILIVASIPSFVYLTDSKTHLKFSFFFPPTAVFFSDICHCDMRYSPFSLLFPGYIYTKDICKFYHSLKQ